MSLEQSFTKFNKEIFKNNFNNILEKYVDILDKFQHIGDYKEENEIDEKEKKEIGLQIDEYKNQLVSLSINALKHIEIKQEAFDAIFDALINPRLELEDIESVYSIKNDLLQAIILELLKMQKIER